MPDAEDPSTANRAARNAFAGGDQQYLRDVQYVDSSKLAIRANLHVAYGRGDWFSWWAQQVPWPMPIGDRPIDVLEVGCGAGWLWAEGAASMPAGIALTLTDLSPGMVAEATERAAGAGAFASVAGRTADAQELPLADDSFDVVVANHMLYHLPDPSRGVAEIARVLRPGGVAAVSTNGATHLTELWQIRAEVFAGLTGVDETIGVFGLEIGEPMLRERFEVVELTRFPDRLRCTDPADVVAFICSTPPADSGSPADIEHVRAAVQRRFDAGGGVLEITKETGLLLCTGPRST